MGNTLISFISFIWFHKLFCLSKHPEIVNISDLVVDSDTIKINLLKQDITNVSHLTSLLVDSGLKALF